MIMQGCREIEVEQGSFEWLQMRQKHVCASDAPIIMGVSPWRTRDQLLWEKIGWGEAQEINSAMKRGMILEKPARKCAEEMLENFYLPGVFVSQKYSWMLASIDGVCIDNKSILEIKCTNKKNHALAKEGKIPDYYMPQVQHQMVVCDVDKCYYFSYDGSGGVVVVVNRDDFYINRLIETEYEFYKEMII